MNNHDNNNLFLPYEHFFIILSSPSGAGKTSLSKQVLQHFQGTVSVSISATTRQPREREIDGVDYHFLPESEFLNKKDKGEFLEWAKVFNHYYGTLKKTIDDMIQKTDIIFDIDWQGAHSLYAYNKTQCVSIFILPPSLVALKERLTTRGDLPNMVASRMAQAKNEISHFDQYDYVIVNDNFEDSFTKIVSIIEAERNKRQRLKTLPSFVDTLLKE